MSFRRLSAVLVLLGLVLSSCSLQTTGGKTGDRTFAARFDDVQHLVIGHSVRISDVPVGTVTSVSLDGFDAVVEFSIENDRPLPVGTTASISSTSLLGENYVRLTLPSSPGAELADGAVLASTGADASFEELTLQLLALTGSIQGRDVSRVVSAGAEALGGRGDELNGLLVTLDEVGDGLVRQTDEFDAVLVQLGDLGQSLAPAATDIADTLELAAGAAGELAEQRDRLVTTVEDITTLAETLEDDVLQPHRADLDRLLDDLTPVVSTLTDDVDTVIGGLESLVVFNEQIPKATSNGELVAYAIYDEFKLGDQRLSTTGLGDVIDSLLDPDPDDPVGGIVGSALDSLEDLLGQLL